MAPDRQGCGERPTAWVSHVSTSNAILSQPSGNHNAWWGLEMARHDPGTQTAGTTDQDIIPLSQGTEAPPIAQQQRVSDAFLSPGPRLEGYIPTLPHKRAKKSYIWQVGIGLAVTEVKTGLKFWLCRYCYDNPVPQPLYLVETDSTTPAIRHLQSRHNYDKKGRRHDTLGQKRKRDTEDIRDAVKRLRDEKERPFDTAN
jgi:hypothetical protein